MLLITNITSPPSRTLSSLKYLQNTESVSKTSKPQRFGKMAVVFSRFSFVAQHKARNRIDSKALGKLCKPNTGFCGGARVNIFTGLDPLDAELQNNKELFLKFCLLAEKNRFYPALCEKDQVVFRSFYEF